MAFDALLVLSFGGPEGPDDVVPFLQNVTRGKDIPVERLKVVGKHYSAFGGVSPINAQNRQLVANLSQVLDLPVYLGNRNWHPFGYEAVEEMVADGRRNAIVFPTSAWGGYSACRQYDEDVQALRTFISEHGYPEITFTKVRHFYDHPGLINLTAEKVRESLDRLPSGRLVFTAHSIPTSDDVASGGPADNHLYSRQVAEASRLVAEAVGVTDYGIAYQSRSGNPRIPWLEPDIVDFLRADPKDLVVCPIGFLTDHMEVVWDLDTELQQAADELGVRVERVPTVGTTMDFATVVQDLIVELRDGHRTMGGSTVTIGGCTVDGQPCTPDCCWSGARMR